MAKHSRNVLLALGVCVVHIVAAQDGFVCTGTPESVKPFNASTTYLGCYTDAESRTLPDVQNNDPDNTPQACANYCGNLGYKYSAVEYTTQCFCGNVITPPGVNANNESACSYACPGDASQKCGATYFMNIYQISNPNPDPPVRPTSRTPLCFTSPFCSLKACDKSLSITERIESLIANYTASEKISNLINTAVGVPRLGVPQYNWWSEALHGVAGSPGVSFGSPNGSNFSYATSFPTPILLGAAFDDELIRNVAAVVGKEARAFGNGLRSGLDFWTPNINTFNDPRWGRGLEVATEDSFHMQSYVANLIPGLQGGNDPTSKQIIATCKHYAVYDVETNRNGQNYNPTPQDLGEYYLTPFKTCVRDAGVGSIMCFYNAVDGVPSCASEYLLQDVLREYWGFEKAPYHYVTGDCDAVQNIYRPHNFTDSAAAAAAVALNAGTDLDCGTNYRTLNTSLANGWVTEAAIDKALTRLYSGLSTVGYFDGQPQYDSLSFKDVSLGSAQVLAYQSAVQGMTLLKNDGVLPLKSPRSVALIGPWANATGQMQGNYQGTAPYLNSPLRAARSQFSTVNYALGTAINSTNTTGYAQALSAARSSDVIIFMGGIDVSIEAEGFDRTAITWPGNQLDLISQLSKLGKPLVVVQFGGGQLDDTALLNNRNVRALMWGGYPGQDGGPAVVDTLVGKKSPAGRLPITQYPASYVNEVSIFDPDLRPSDKNPGRTYKWYTKKPVLPFGYGLHYTTFAFKPVPSLRRSYDIASLVRNAKNDASPFDTLRIAVTNTGRTTSDYVALLFVRSTNAGPKPYPNKSLVAYTRAKNLSPRQTQTLELKMTLGSIARANADGDLVLYPGRYELQLDNDASLKATFELTGKEMVIDTLPRRAAQYNYTVPVHPQA